ncbi:MAG: hypothetical protein K5891_11230 [Lachnospiraceae bacterium]|nr:hypothetical protein [Lachnospiraceae bacterium]
MIALLHDYGYKKILFLFLVAVGGCIFLFASRKKLWERRYSFLFLLGVVAVTTLPELTGKGLAYGHDLLFHMNRVESLTQELRLGHFPAKIPYLWMDGYGYPSSIMYNDILLYIPAVLRLIGFDLKTVFLWYILLINAGTALSSCGCFSKIFASERIGQILSLVYCMSSYRLVDLYTRAAVGEYSAFCFFPVIALAMWELLYEEKVGLRQAILLALGVSGVLSVHLLSLVSVGVGLIVVLLFHIKVVGKKNFLSVIFGAMGIFAALNAYYLVPFADYILTVPMKITGMSYSGTPFADQGSRAGVDQIFGVFRSVMPLKITDTQLSPGLVLLLTLVFALLLFVKGMGNRRMLFLGGVSLFFLFLSSEMFPWEELTDLFPFVRNVDVIQFSWRLMTLPVVFLTLLLGECLSAGFQDKNPKDRISKCIVGGIVFLELFTVPFLYTDQNNYWAAFRDQWDLNLSYVGKGEYLRLGSAVPEEKADPIFYDLEGSVLGFHGTFCLLSVQDAGKEAFVQIPVFNYKGYIAENEVTGERLTIVDGDNNMIRVLIPEGYSGNVLVMFRELWYWRLAETVSLLSALILVIGGTICLHGARRCRKNAVA